jgi:hypothetical protein
MIRGPSCLQYNIMNSLSDQLEIGYILTLQLLQRCSEASIQQVILGMHFPVPKPLGVLDIQPLILFLVLLCTTPPPTGFQSLIWSWGTKILSWLFCWDFCMSQWLAYTHLPLVSTDTKFIGVGWHLGIKKWDVNISYSIFLELNSEVYYALINATIFDEHYCSPQINYLEMLNLH